VQRKYVAWLNSARTRLNAPLTFDQQALVLERLALGEPVVIDETVLKLEACDWPVPHGAGFQVFGRNGLGVELCDVLTLDHPQPLQPEKLALALAWAVRQKTQPSAQAVDPDNGYGWDPQCCD
jgi:hypothetical protein